MKAPYINNIRCFHFISSSFSLKHMTQFTEYSLFSCECRLYIGCSFQILEMLLFAGIEVFWNVNRYIYNQVTYSITIDRRQSFSPKPEYFSGSMPLMRSTLGWIMPAPSTSIHPSPLQVGQPRPPHLWHWMSISQEGSVKGK